VRRCSGVRLPDGQHALLHRQRVEDEEEVVLDAHAEAKQRRPLAPQRHAADAG
jgi:hypothetical protein